MADSPEKTKQKALAAGIKGSVIRNFIEENNTSTYKIGMHKRKKLGIHR